MKKTSIINLVLVATITAACGKEEEWEGGGGSDRKVYLRSDTTAAYTKSKHYNYVSYYAFRPYSSSSGGLNTYSKRTGYYSEGIHSSSNVGHNSSKGSISRGGFGHSGFHVSS
ncbi:hypothetical protein B0A78_13035 [Flavobacterium columnare NBRC 100251 = ATCC 23463]|uniref:Lipoprotein n=2 Tax=Flavobacterium columnare TaxID=996 RepID=G8X4K2_FLACA|nr:hypothetical protein [Flavobacterium columnare]AEW85427.1 hypothetical protein FCOL_02910 [Flavobacterium columnare ATCC 49512]AMO19751.1 hypothetical protein UN65_04780 [Flavobacterium columnare]ANO48788.1 hypothetical protein Pf1_00540 [Flavobacterium columnare]APT23184.1 hypothetical protein BU993_11485 [Flavobacterium columnare]AUX17682.1 hypothetical protein AQ623_04880 [Flavobacterium columnare]